MKAIICFLLVSSSLMLTHLQSNAQTTVVRFTVELPEPRIPADSSVYLAGNFNGWNAHDENYRMKRLDDRRYQLDVPCFANRNYEYKYTLGDWAYVERAADGSEISNRKLFSSKKAKADDKVVKWNVPVAKVQKAQPFLQSLTDSQKAKMAAVKDSMALSLGAIVPRLKDLLGKTNENLLLENPNPTLSKELRGQFSSEIGELLGKIYDGLGELVEELSPEQREMLRKVVRDSEDPAALINLIM